MADGVNNDTAATQIEDILNDLYNCGLDFSLRIYVNNENIFLYDYKSNGEKKKLSHEKILEKIDSMKDTNEMIRESK